MCCFVKEKIKTTQSQYRHFNILLLRVRDPNGRTHDAGEWNKG